MKVVSLLLALLAVCQWQNCASMNLRATSDSSSLMANNFLPNVANLIKKATDIRKSVNPPSAHLLNALQGLQAQEASLLQELKEIANDEV